ncbi:nucleolar [Halobacteriales archaeon QH_8_68_33]|nr:MAG: nucleolar [Halobacteriales archaeon QH_8_68_33]
MSDNEGWFAGLDPDDRAGAVERVRSGGTGAPAEWPDRAVSSGFAADADEYYDLLHEATVTATRAEVHERERADDQQLVHAVRAMDDTRRTANELAERVAEWAGSREDDAGSGVAYARELAGDASPTDGSGDADDPASGRLHALAARTAELADEADQLERFVETAAHDVAPNLAAMAGPVLAARLISLAGGLADLAKMPSSTVQVLGAEEALFAHLRGSAPSPKHGVIFTHEYVRGTREAGRGSAARALAGKLTIAARVDHYSGERRPELDAELDERIRTIRARGDGS